MRTKEYEDLNNYLNLLWVHRIQSLFHLHRISLSLFFYILHQKGMQFLNFLSFSFILLFNISVCSNVCARIRIDKVGGSEVKYFKWGLFCHTHCDSVGK